MATRSRKECGPVARRGRRRHHRGCGRGTDTGLSAPPCFTGTTATPRALGARSMHRVGRSSSIAGPDAPTSVAAYSRGRRSRLTGGYWAAIGIGRNCPAQRDGDAARVAERCPPTLLPRADIEEGALRR
jgi:hypothetical protein